MKAQPRLMQVYLQGQASALVKEEKQCWIPEVLPKPVSDLIYEI